MTTNDFSTICRNIAALFTELADAYEAAKLSLIARYDYLDDEVAKTNETKRKMLKALQEDLNG